MTFKHCLVHPLNYYIIILIIIFIDKVLLNIQRLLNYVILKEMIAFKINDVMMTMVMDILLVIVKQITTS